MLLKIKIKLQDSWGTTQKLKLLYEVDESHLRNCPLGFFCYIFKQRGKRGVLWCGVCNLATWTRFFLGCELKGKILERVLSKTSEVAELLLCCILYLNLVV